MHKKICKSIEFVLNNVYSPATTYQRITIIQNPTGGSGFWKMEIVLKPKMKHLTKHIESLGYNIGHFLGESLWKEVKGRTIKFS